MIKLEVADYCGECLDFTPDVEKPTKLFFSDYEGVYMSDTVVYCSNRKRCEAIRRYLEQKMEEDLDPYTRT